MQHRAVLFFVFYKNENLQMAFWEAIPPLDLKHYGQKMS